MTASSSRPKPRRMKCCYEIDRSRTTPETVNWLWWQLFADATDGSIHVHTETDRLLLEARGYDRANRTWWHSTGGGVTIYESDDLATVAALATFFVVHGRLFRRVWAGPLYASPDSDEHRGGWLSLGTRRHRGHMRIVRGEAV